MKLFVSAEDELSRAVIAKMTKVVLGEEVDIVSLGHRNGGFGYIRKNLAKFCDLALRERVIVLTDLDGAVCAPSLRTSWLDTLTGFNDFPEQMVFCVAVREVEAWLMADRGAFADFFSVPASAIGNDIENSVVDPKEYLVTTVRRTSVRSVRDAVVPDRRSHASVGLGYNQLLSQFVAEAWMPERGASQSVSLQRACDRMRSLLDVST